MIGIARSLERSKGAKPTTGFSIERTVVLRFGYIPRGRSRSPEFTKPKASVPVEDLLALLDKSAREIARVPSFDRAAWFHHPLLGPMDRDQALRFVQVHHRHHLKIVADIVSARPAR